MRKRTVVVDQSHFVVAHEPTTPRQSPTSSLRLSFAGSIHLHDLISKQMVFLCEPEIQKTGRSDTGQLTSVSIRRRGEAILDLGVLCRLEFLLLACGCKDL